MNNTLEYIDLGLPSGNLWALNYDTSRSNVKENIHINKGIAPSRKDFVELMEYCKTSCGYLVSRKNGKSIKDGYASKYLIKFK